jgi:hypothetical protein
MSAREKAFELLYKVSCIIDKPSNYNETKLLALITINEMLDFRNGLYINEGSLAHQYLLEIKQQIEEL